MATTTRAFGICGTFVMLLSGCATALEDGGRGSGHDALSAGEVGTCAEHEARGETCPDPADRAPGATGDASDSAPGATTDASDRAPSRDDETDPGIAPMPLPPCADDVATGARCATDAADAVTSATCQRDDRSVCTCLASSDSADAAASRWSCVAPDPGPAPALCRRGVVTGALCPLDGARSCARADGSRCECVETAAEDGTLVIAWRCEDPPPPPAMCPSGVHPASTMRVECRAPATFCNVGDYWCECVEDDLRDPPFPVYYWRCPLPPPPPAPACPPGVFPGSDRDVSCDPDRDRSCSVHGASCRCTEDTRRAGPLPVFHWECESGGPVPSPAAD